MAVASSVARPSSGGSGLRSCAGLTLALLTASLAAPGPVRAAGPPAESQAAQLDRLSTTLGDLKSSLTAIREGLEGMRSSPEAAGPPPPDAACAAPAVVSGTPEVGADELARLRSERAALKERIAGLEKVVKQARTGEATAARARGPLGSPIESAAAAEFDAPPRGGSVRTASQPAGAPGADAPAGADDGTALQLRADLALAQLKITNLSEELTSTRANQAALEAELQSLRSLTDAKIKRFMGWQ